MKKRISDEELEGYDTTIIPCGNFNRLKIESLVEDLKDARAKLEEYEPKKPSLYGYLITRGNR